jgi:hypothetical protein
MASAGENLGRVPRSTGGFADFEDHSPRHQMLVLLRQIAGVYRHSHETMRPMKAVGRPGGTAKLV